MHSLGSLGSPGRVHTCTRPLMPHSPSSSPSTFLPALPLTCSSLACPPPNPSPDPSPHPNLTLYPLTLHPSGQVRGDGAGLLAAAAVGMVPSYISRSVAGSYDNEGVAIFALVNVFYLFVKV